MAEQTGAKRRGWLTILLSVAALIALGFAVYALAVNWRVSRSDDARRVRDLAIAAINIETWPGTAEQIGKSNLYHEGVDQGGHALVKKRRTKIWLFHPDLADFQVEYHLPVARGTGPDKFKCEEKVGIDDDKMTVMGVALAGREAEADRYRERLRSASWFQPPGARDRSICFAITKLDLKAVTAVPRGFEHLLLAQVSTSAKPPAVSSGRAVVAEIADGTTVARMSADDKALAPSSGGGAAPGGTAPASDSAAAPQSGGGASPGVPALRGPVVAQIGDYRLPIRSLAELPDVEPQLVDMARALAQVTGGAKASAEKQDAKRVRRDALQPLDSNVAGTSYRFYFYPVTLKNGGEYLLVGAARNEAETATFGRLGPRALAFVIALAFLAALTPTLKLALLGPVDGIKPIEVGALVLGLLTAAAVATAAVIATADVISVRGAALLRLSESAAAIRTRTVTEVHRVLLGRDGSSIECLSQTMSAPAQLNPGCRHSKVAARYSPSFLIAGAPDLWTETRDFSQPDSLFPVGRGGRQADGVVLAAARDMSGTGYELYNRPYFRRAVDGDFAPGSEELAGMMRARLGGIWNCMAEGLIFEQVRSRPDGVAKTVAAAAIRQDCPEAATLIAGRNGPGRSGKKPEADRDLDEDRDSLRVLGVSLVLKSLLSPALHEREQFAVLDASKDVAGLPVLFHSERGRANIERFAEALNAPAKRGFASVAKDEQACAEGAELSDIGSVETFGGAYEGEQTLFAATRLPCTDWIVATFLPRDRVDGYATQGATYAVMIWIGGLLLLIALFLIVNLLKRARHDRPAWLWLWPEPKKRARYARAVRLLLLVVAFTTAFIMLSDVPVLAALFGPPLAGAALYAAIFRDEHVRRFWSFIVSRWPFKRAGAATSSAPPPPPTPPPAPPPAEPCERNKLDAEVERNFRTIILLVVLSLSVLPMVALSRDARGYFDAQQIGDDSFALQQAIGQEQRGIEAVALTYRKAARAAPAPERPALKWLCPIAPDEKGAIDLVTRFGLFGLTHDGQPCFDGIKTGFRDKETGQIVKELGFQPPWSLTEAMRRSALRMDQHSLYGDPASIAYPVWTGTQWIIFLGVVALVGGVLVMAFRSALRGLFGFGVVLEAVSYPRLPKKPDKQLALPFIGSGQSPPSVIEFGLLPPRFIVVAAQDDVRRELGREAIWVDLFAMTEAEPPSLKTPVRLPVAPVPLMLFSNLEMLMRNRERRLKALKILERAVAEQGRGAGGDAFKIGLITDISPLDRLLHSYERDAEELERLSAEELPAKRAELAGEREEMRWSRLFESFTTYIYCAVPRRAVAHTISNPGERKVVSVVEKEVAYLPDHVVAAMMPYKRAPLEPEEIAEWAKTLKGSEPRAIWDYLSSMLIEHYALAWSVSSHAERLLLYRYAHDEFVNIRQAYALRSLVRRGLVVLDPVPRIMNRSFAQFVRNAEKPKTLERWRGETQRSAWQALGTPLMIALPFALGVVAVIAIRSGESIAALIPFVVSVGPALVNFLNGGRKAAA